MIGFPARSSDIYESGLGSHGAARIIAETLDELGWKYSVTDHGVFRAQVPISAASWGEALTVEIMPDGLVQVESRCSWQIFDWGKNRQNVKKFIGRLGQKEIGHESSGTGAEDSNFEKDNSSRVEKLFEEDEK